MRVAVLAFALTALIAIPAEADVVTFDFDIEFSGATPPSGATPWLKITFNDHNTPGTVDMTIDTTGLVGTEYIGGVNTFDGAGGIYLNFNPGKTLIGDIGFIHALKPGSTGNQVTAVFGGENAFKADGDGYYDLRMVWVNSLTAGNVQTYEWYNTSGTLVASDFKFGSLDSGNGQSFLAAAHVQGVGIGANFSGWIAPSDGGTIPEPTSLLLLGLSAAFVVRRRR